MFASSKHLEFITLTENFLLEKVVMTVGLLFLSLALQEKGNEYVKQGKKHYSDAIDCYTRAINQNVLTGSENSILFANRAHVNLLLGNYRRALMDAEEAIKLCPTNVKVGSYFMFRFLVGLSLLLV